MSATTIPVHLSRNMYWKPVIHLFKNHSKLQDYFTTKYFDLENEVIQIRKLKAVAKPWSQSEKFMLNLAFHLFNDSNKLPNGLGGMACLDENNTKLAVEAIQLRFGA